jgi:hypothetical protein
MYHYAIIAGRRSWAKDHKPFNQHTFKMPLTHQFFCNLRIVFVTTMATLVLNGAMGQEIKSSKGNDTLNHMDLSSTIAELNNKLGKKLTYVFDLRKADVANIRSNHPAIRESLAALASFNIEQFKAELKKDLVERLIPAWLRYQSADSVNRYDCILFEYSDQETPPYEAFSYGMYDMGEYMLTIEPHWFRSAEHNGWEAGAGLSLEPFLICKPFHISVLGSAEYDKLHNQES